MTTSDTFTLDTARDAIQQQRTDHQPANTTPVAIELGRRQREQLEQQLYAEHGATGPLRELFGLPVRAADDEDRLQLVWPEA